MEYDCGRTGCTGGGTFLLFVFGGWVLAGGFILFGEPESLKEYVKSIPSRVILFAVVTGIFWVIGWIVSKVESFLFG